MKDYLSALLPADKMAAILDIGAGTGDVLEYLIARGYTHCAGVDVDAGMVDACVKKGLGDKVVRIDDLAAYLADKKARYDLVNLKEVLYYFPDDILADYLGLIKDALKEGGVLVVEVFNGALLTGAFFKHKDYKIKRVFTEQSLKTVLQDAGFEVTSLFGTQIQASSFKRVLWIVVRSLWIGILKMIYALELGWGGERPTIWSKLIVAVARKR